MALRNEPIFWRGNRDLACLLLHGLGAGTYEMQLLAEVLHGYDLTVQAPLYPGHDTPAWWMPASTWPQWYATVEQAYQGLAQEHSVVFVVGFSTGCPLALQLARHYTFAGLVCLCPYFSLHRPWFSPLPLEPLIATVGQLLPQVPRLSLPIRDPALQPQAKAAKFYHSFNLVAVRSAMDLIQTIKPHLSDITIPTLIIQARHDSIVNPQGAVELLASLGSEDKRLIWLEHSDHIVTLDYDRDRVTQEILQFCQIIPPPTPL